MTIANAYSYDQVGRKLNTWEQITNGNGTPPTNITSTTNPLISQIDYNETGQVLNKHLHSTDGVTFLQNIAYAYNERGWLLTSTAPLFAMQLYYNTNAGSKAYNGNIMYQYWTTQGNPTDNYNYSCDKLNRLVGGATPEGNAEYMGYDLMGNFSWMNRYQTNTLIDQLGYSYNGNQLQSIGDFTTNDAGMKHGSWNYTYDKNGNLLTDPSKGTTGISMAYNLLNLPQSITGSKTITCTYDALGNKLRRVNPATGNTDYVGGIQYENGAIAFIQTEEGRALANGASYNYEYNLVDNLGNTRVTFDSATGVARMEQQDNYYPFGMEISVGTIPSPKNEYLYNKKELQEELAEYDYGARFYDPVIGRFTSIDPLAEKGRRWSPYSYGMDDPILMVDPDGMWPFPVLIRSFAPFKSFGLGFAGDNRGYSTSSTATSRVAQSFTVDPAKGTHTAPLTSSSPSEHPLLGTATAKDDKGSITNFNSTANKDGSNTVSFTSNMAGGNPLTRNLDIPTPDIDVHTNFTMTENDMAGTLNVNAVQTGDAFPSAETMMGDTKGNQLFIGVSAANGSPFTSLEGDNNRPMMQANFTITMDSKGVFTGVQQGDKKYSTADWNKMNQNKPTVQQ